MIEVITRLENLKSKYAAYGQRIDELTKLITDGKPINGIVGDNYIPWIYEQLSDTFLAMATIDREITHLKKQQE